MIKHPFSSKFFVAPLACALGFALSVPAQADAINGLVDSWTVDVDTRFVPATVQPAGVTAGPSGDPTLSLRWGPDSVALADRSGLDITNSPSSETVLTNGAAVNNVSITHLNRTMPAGGPTLTAVDIISTLTLTPLSPAGALLPLGSLTFHVHFLETPNEPGSNTIGVDSCADGDLLGSGLNSPGCADIFVTDLTGISGPFSYDLDGVGALPARDYFINFFEIGNSLIPLPDSACTNAGVSIPCQGFETREAEDTTITFATQIFAEIEPDNQVPEPASLALIGLALAGLGLARRRKA